MNRVPTMPEPRAGRRWNAPMYYLASVDPEGNLSEVVSGPHPTPAACPQATLPREYHDAGWNIITVKATTLLEEVTS